MNKKRIILALNVIPDRIPKGREILLAYEVYYQVTGRNLPAEAGVVKLPVSADVSFCFEAALFVKVATLLKPQPACHDVACLSIYTLR